MIAASGQLPSARNVLGTERARGEPPTRKIDVVASLTDLRVNLSVESARSDRSRRRSTLGLIAMFQFLRKPSSRTQFRARSAGRDAETDHARALSILRAVDEALDAAKVEQNGLSERIDDVLGRAAVTFGNASDEYLTREPQDSRHQDLMGREIANGQRRLAELDVTIAHFEFLRTAVLTRFPNLGVSNVVPTQNATE
jgi:hypothetical protein